LPVRLRDAQPAVEGMLDGQGEFCEIFRKGSELSQIIKKRLKIVAENGIVNS
jgi:hypothetical protein